MVVYGPEFAEDLSSGLVLGQLVLHPQERLEPELEQVQLVLALVPGRLEQVPELALEVGAVLLRLLLRLRVFPWRLPMLVRRWPSAH